MSLSASTAGHAGKTGLFPEEAASLRRLKVAVVHDWLVVYGGAERVLREILAVFPQADVFSVVCFLSDEERAAIGLPPVRTSFVQKLPGAKNKYRRYIPLMPMAVEQFDFSGYDLVVSSSYSVAKGILTGPDQLHVAYVHSPMRYAWDLQHAYLREARLQAGLKSALARALLHYLRLWDARTANGPDSLIANSQFIARRIRKVYGREASVIYPPVDLDRFALHAAKDDFYLVVSRLVPYKCVPLIVEAFAEMPQAKLVVIGDGPEMAKVRAVATPNVSVLGYQPDAVVQAHMRRAKAFVIAAEEDFGITALEAQACGTPVICLGRGGARETVRGLSDERPTGVHFSEQSVPSLIDAVVRFEAHGHRIRQETCRANAERFSPQRFREEIAAHVLGELRKSGAPISASEVESAPALRPMVA